MDNSIHQHVFDPALNHDHNGVPEEQRNQDDPSTSTAVLNPDGTPIKRRPGRPKGSTKKNLLAGGPLPPKPKRPVGRPRKDGFPAGSVGPRVKRERTVGVPQVVQYPGVAYPPMPYGYSISAPIPPAVAAAAAAPMFQIDPSLAGDNEWADLARTNPNAFLSTLLAALAAPNPVSSAGPTVEEAFKSHLVSLAPNPSQMQPIPSLYSILKTFWLPSSPAYFSLTASASTARTPSEHRFLYWDPQPLVFNGIACPSCSAPLINKGRISSGPVKIYDIERPFFIVGCEYVCRSPTCIAATGSPEGRKYASTDSSILRSLPLLLKDEFPAKLLNGDADAGSGPNVWNWKAMGVSSGLWHLVMGALRSGLKKDVILRLIWSVQTKATDTPAESIAIAPQSKPVVLPPPPPPPPAPIQDGQVQENDQEGDKMEDGEDEDHEMSNAEDDGVNGQDQADSSQTQTLSTNAFSDAYGDAWKENTATVETQAKNPTVNGASTTPISAQPQPSPASGSATSSGGPTPGPSVAAAPSTAPAPTQPTPTPSAAAPPTPQGVTVMSPQPPQMLQAIPNYNPYAYPFTPYAYMPHHIVNGTLMQAGPSGMVPSSGMPQQPQQQPQQPQQPPQLQQQQMGAVNGLPGATQMVTVQHNKRSPRHCCKCGSQECKGKGGRSFCTNGCQDCGKMDCKGRNSRRPDKKCTEGWT
ncbi:hypothetical protein JR316_0006333 [Psilocybe cubensis]|uniref:Uncharacterized protein n=2 Tax=Psilocybe cubensis TaxID=181762 RepID=A0A8H8CM96_PSICU|nr:hypothetical protein JR316_0006333 [Psilocybe cubensis]KAH9481806.1 hypothetical protein JR316_0006333 [Psilocybe cubensis]